MHPVSEGAAGSVRPSVVRVARRTVRLEECTAFYRDVLGLPVIASFRDHDGYDGDVLGLPDARVQLELVRTPSGAALPSQDDEDALVLYVEDLQPLRERLEHGGVAVRSAENPYWQRSGAFVVHDPEGRSVLLAPAQEA